MTSFNESNSVQLSDLTSDLPATQRKAWCHNVKQGDGIYHKTCSDRCTFTTGSVCISSCTLNKVNIASPNGNRHSDVHHTDHSVVPHTETSSCKSLGLHNATSGFAQQSICYYVSLFIIAFIITLDSIM